MNLLRMLAIFALAYVGVRIIRRLLQPRAPTPDPMRRARTIEGADMIRDPACGLYTPRDSAFEARIGGETHYFCSEQCSRDFAGGKRAEKKAE